MDIHHGAIARLKPERAAEYLALHRAVPTEVQALLRAAGVRDYAIFQRDGWLFASYRFVGTDHDAAMARMVAEPAMRAWWACCVPCFDCADPAQPWLPMDPAYHQV